MKQCKVCKKFNVEHEGEICSVECMEVELNENNATD